LTHTVGYMGEFYTSKDPTNHGNQQYKVLKEDIHTRIKNNKRTR